MTLLVLTVFGVVLVSAWCSTTEAALYAVSWTHIEKLRKAGSKSGELLYALRSDVNKPIAAVLTLNTVANTAGAALAGALAAEVLGAQATAWFAAMLTLLILAFGEIVPKTIGVTYAGGVAAFMARPLQLMVLVFTPFIWLSGLLTRLITHGAKTEGFAATEDDIRAITSMSRRAGRIQAYEESAIRNILLLDSKHVYEIMTPRTVVHSFPADITVAEAYANPKFWHYSRVPVYGEDNEDIIGLVLRRRVAQAMAEDQGHLLLRDLMQSVRFVLENRTVDQLLLDFLNSRMHLMVVIDEYGGLAGVVSLEDVLEEMLGREIVDDTDSIADHRAAAAKGRKHLDEKPDSPEALSCPDEPHSLPVADGSVAGGQVNGQQGTKPDGA